MSEPRAIIGKPPMMDGSGARRDELKVMANAIDVDNRVRRSDRIPPHNLEAEQAVLGAMLLSAEAVEGALGMLGDTDFYRPAHGRIFTAMNDLYARSVPVDHLSVADRLESRGRSRPPEASRTCSICPAPFPQPPTGSGTRRS